MNRRFLCSFALRSSKFKLSYRTKSSAVNIAANKESEDLLSSRASEKLKANLEEWNQARPFETIPGPKPLPLIGNTWRFFLPKIGDFYGLDFLDIHREINNQFGDIALLKGIFLHQPVLLLFNPTDIEKFLRNEGTWPVRRGFPSLRHYRRLRKDLIPRGGLITLEGEEWYQFRKLVNPVLLKPQNIIQYTDKISTVTEELVDNIKYFSQKNEEGQMPDDFEYELYRWSTEAVGVVMMDNQFGCLKRDVDENSEPRKLMRSVLQVFDLMYNLDVLPGIWKVVSTPSWRKFVKNADFVLETSLRHINRRLDQLDRGEIDETKEEIQSVLFQLAKVDRDVAKAWSAEMVLSGVDTTARVLAAALYYLAKNPQKQDTLREEAFSLLETKNTPVTKETLTKNSYTKAVVKETTRLAPVTNGIVRVSAKNMVLGGYQIPPGVHIQTSNLLISKKDEHFPKASEFLPERWLSTTHGEMSHKNTSPFVSLPFGFGPRTCAGRRLANLELEVALLKIIRNFELKWPHEDMVFKTHILHGIAQPLKLHVKEI